MKQTVWYLPEFDQLFICSSRFWPDTALDIGNQSWLVDKYNWVYECFYLGEL